MTIMWLLRHIIQRWLMVVSENEAVGFLKNTKGIIIFA